MSGNRLVKSLRALLAAFGSRGRSLKRGSPALYQMAHGAVLLENRLPVAGGSRSRGRDGLDRAQIHCERGALRIGPGERRHHAVVHEFKAAQHGLNLVLIPLAQGQVMFDPPVGVGRVAALALDAKYLAAHRRLIALASGHDC